ncbi:MAG TPA: helix-turn-helix transcriptional regulator, partial [Caldilineaceae bacterium]|nr:helix-turn-helix transcriptional regulator [Caldilineaceae bacterium]
MFNYISRRPGPGGAQRHEKNGAVNGVPQMHELGAMLRKRREAMGATLAEVETATKIRQKYLAALEADEWQLLPGEVVGRGFLRNYATYLGLDANELIERRRAVADPGLSTALAGTSAASALPPPRQVDYRPKDVPLHEEEGGIEERRDLNLGPVFAVAGMVVLLLLVAWMLFVFGGRMMAGVANLVDGVQGWTSTAFSPPAATPTEAAQVAMNTPPPT